MLRLVPIDGLEGDLLVYEEAAGAGGIRGPCRCGADDERGSGTDRYFLSAFRSRSRLVNLILHPVVSARPGENLGQRGRDPCEQGQVNVERHEEDGCKAGSSATAHRPGRKMGIVMMMVRIKAENTILRIAARCDSIVSVALVGSVNLRAAK